MATPATTTSSGTTATVLRSVTIVADVGTHLVSIHAFFPRDWGVERSCRNGASLLFPRFDSVGFWFEVLCGRIPTVERREVHVCP